MFISGSFHLPAYCVDEKVAINVEKEKYRDVLAPPSSDIQTHASGQTLRCRD